MAHSVINLKGRPSKTVNDDEVYIGRAMNMGGWKCQKSKWQNPFTKKDGTVEERVEKYEKYLTESKELMAAIPELVGKKLACWCAPGPCHGDVLRRLSGNTSIGDVQVGKLPNRFSRMGSKEWPSIEGYHRFNVSSSSSGFGNNLSPFKVGPIKFTEVMPDGKEIEREATCLENLWQATKVRVIHRLSNMPVGEWWRIRNKIWADPKPYRHTIPKNERTGDIKDAVSFWNGMYISYELARWQIYIKFYSQYVAELDDYKTLEDMIKRGHNILLIGPDGRRVDNYQHEFNDLSKPFGHELVLAAMLRNERVWERVSDAGVDVAELSLEMKE